MNLMPGKHFVALLSSFVVKYCSSSAIGQGSVCMTRQAEVRWSRPVQNASRSPDCSVDLENVLHHVSQFC